jgi:hypothetical protein
MPIKHSREHRGNSLLAYLEDLFDIMRQGFMRRDSDLVIEISENVDEFGIFDYGKWTVASYNPQGKLQPEFQSRIC